MTVGSGVRLNPSENASLMVSRRGLASAAPPLRRLVVGSHSTAAWGLTGGLACVALSGLGRRVIDGLCLWMGMGAVVNACGSVHSVRKVKYIADLLDVEQPTACVNIRSSMRLTIDVPTAREMRSWPVLRSADPKVLGIVCARGGGLGEM